MRAKIRWMFATMLVLLGGVPAEAGVSNQQLGRILLGSNSRGMNENYEFLDSDPVHGTHPGLDFPASVGTEFFAPADGLVTIVDEGNGILVIDDSEYAYIFLHLDWIDVQVGDLVSAGMFLGETGATLYKRSPISGPHLHIEVRPTGRTTPASQTDPSSYNLNSDPRDVIVPQLRNVVVVGESTVPGGSTWKYYAYGSWTDMRRTDLSREVAWSEASPSASIDYRGYLKTTRVKRDESMVITVRYGHPIEGSFTTTKRVTIRK